MSDFFRREAADGGDNGIWADFEEDQNAPARSINTVVFYNNGGLLYRKPGKVGLDNGSNKGVITFVSDTGPISLAGLTASRWAEIVVSVVGTAPSLTLYSIGTGTDPATIPAAFLAEAEYAKMGFYRTATARTLALVWINAAGNLEGIVNMLDGIAYAGYSTSDDAYDTIYNFNYQKYALPLIPERKIYEQSAAFTAGRYYSYQSHSVTNAANSFAATIPAASAARVGQRIRVEKIDTGAGITTITRTGADTFGVTGATAFPLRVQGDFIEIECVTVGAGYNWACVDSLATLDTVALTGNTYYTLPHGMAAMPRKCKRVLRNGTGELGYAAGEESEESSNFYGGGGVDDQWGVQKDATNIYFKTPVNSIVVSRKDTGAMANLTYASWIARFRYSL